VITSYLELVQKLLERKTTVIKGAPVKELVNCALWLECPRDMFVTFHHRNLDYGYFAALVAWYFRARSHKLDGIDQYGDQWKRVTEPDINSNYGVYVFGEGQLKVAINRLVNNPTSRQAVIMFNRPDINVSDTRDHICTTSLQFLVRDNKLVLITTMRSNDFWNGLCYDIPFFMLLQLIVFEHLTRFQPLHSLELGAYYHNVGSMHAYERNWEKMARIMVDPVTNPHGFPRFSGLVDLLHLTERLGFVEEEIRAQAFSGNVGRAATGQPVFDWFVDRLLGKHNLCTSS
jgi:thymidylate synthase